MVHDIYIPELVGKKISFTVETSMLGTIMEVGEHLVKYAAGAAGWLDKGTGWAPKHKVEAEKLEPGQKCNVKANVTVVGVIAIAYKGGGGGSKSGPAFDVKVDGASRLIPMSLVDSITD